MNEPWFDAATYAWIPGTVYGSTLGVWGGISGWLAGTGKARGLCLSIWTAFLIVAVGLLLLGGIAWSAGQPYGIWYGLGLPGLIGLILCPILIPQVRARYGEAEERRMQAADFGEQ